MKDKNYITKGDFDKAVKQRWQTNTCVVAQYLIRTQGKSTGEQTSSLWRECPKVTPIQDIFDVGFYQPGDEKKNPSLIKLRKSLPIKIR